jgi:hypothetical protein
VRLSHGRQELALSRGLSYCLDYELAKDRRRLERMWVARHGGRLAAMGASGGDAVNAAPSRT